MSQNSKNPRIKRLYIFYRVGAWVHWEFKCQRGMSFVRNHTAYDALLCDADLRLSKSAQKNIRREVARWLQEEQQ
jgi:hypothetical protein